MERRREKTAQPRDTVLDLRVMDVLHASLIVRAVEMNRGRKEGTAAAVFCRSNVEDGRTMQRLPFRPSQLD